MGCCGGKKSSPKKAPTLKAPAPLKTTTKRDGDYVVHDGKRYKLLNPKHKR